MPIYEYRCEGCAHEFETIQKVSEEALRTCPECDQNALIKKVSAAGFRLKGKGWYETDFKSGNKRNVAGDSKPSTETSSASSDSGGNGGSKSSAGSSSGDSGSKKDSTGSSSSSAKKSE